MQYYGYKIDFNERPWYYYKVYITRKLFSSTLVYYFVHCCSLRQKQRIIKGSGGGRSPESPLNHIQRAIEVI